MIEEIARPQLLTLTDAAANRVKELISKSDTPVAGLRVGVSSKGCSGKSYVFEYAEAKIGLEEEVESKGVRIFIDPMAIMFLMGSEMDYLEDNLQSGFVFNNPNAKNVCGCGESFSV
ncbi:MAG: Fe-S cluster assembly scaffold SufA [Rhodospirillaceae bacterium TMED8]|nr:Fe-S cluster assembly scaffold SufA [Magnetovibrio sp.]OUT51425.1 MAG: Fe-S cluster assembly scaffold SufA [Rhodospirillaceae bacterium TMED8]|tara:strand:+ start:7531 stop:7881 length:351 start_codon:yes stop_codon:yes gene_type:complete